MDNRASARRCLCWSVGEKLKTPSVIHVNDRLCVEFLDAKVQGCKGARVQEECNFQTGFSRVSCARSCCTGSESTKTKLGCVLHRVRISFRAFIVVVCHLCFPIIVWTHACSAPVDHFSQFVFVEDFGYQNQYLIMERPQVNSFSLPGR